MPSDRQHWLIMSMPINRAMFLGDEGIPAADLEQQVDAGVRTFLAAYMRSPSL